MGFVYFCGCVVFGSDLLKLCFGMIVVGGVVVFRVGSDFGCWELMILL